MIYYLYVKTEEEYKNLIDILNNCEIQWIKVQPLFQAEVHGVRAYIPNTEHWLLIKLKFEFTKKIIIPVFDHQEQVENFKFKI